MLTGATRHDDRRSEFTQMKNNCGRKERQLKILLLMASGIL